MVLRPRRRIYHGFMLGAQGLLGVCGLIYIINRQYFDKIIDEKNKSEVANFSFLLLGQNLIAQKTVVSVTQIARDRVIKWWTGSSD